jgi:putative membrane protein
MFLTNDERRAVDAAVARVEARTGVQVVTAVIGKSDSYPELPWKAFALGASLAALAVVAIDAWRPSWTTSATALLHVVATVGAGAAAALGAVLFPPFARLFLRSTRRDAEVRQYAEGLFLRRELDRTVQRTGLLILISLFERRVEIVPDAGFRGRVTDAEWQTVVARMTARLRDESPAAALQDALAAVEALLAERGYAVGAGVAVANELPNEPIEERGE